MQYLRFALVVPQTMDLGQLHEEKDLWSHDKTLRRVRFLFLPYCTEGHWVLIVFDFGPASVVVWNQGRVAWLSQVA